MDLTAYWRLLPMIVFAFTSTVAAASQLSETDFLKLEKIALRPAATRSQWLRNDESEPFLVRFAPHRSGAPRAAVLVLPGGGYRFLSGTLEGREPAAWLAARGYAAFVLSYRVGSASPFPAPLLDAQRAMRVLRANAVRLGIDPNRVGVMGFSAGGHLALATATLKAEPPTAARDATDGLDPRPDFLILAYPAFSMFTRTPSPVQYCGVLLKTYRCDDAYLDKWRPELAITAQTPPTFLYHTGTDTLVPAEDSIDAFLELRRQGVSSELHVFAAGPHGTGLGGTDDTLSGWPELLRKWLNRVAAPDRTGGSIPR